MTKREFLEKLRAALAEDLSGAAVQEQVAFYRQYIEDEVRKGRSEEAVSYTHLDVYKRQRQNRSLEAQATRP